MVEVLRKCKLSILFFLLLTFVLQVSAMEVYIPGQVKKETACCYIVKTSEGRFVKILKPAKKPKNKDPFKFKATMSFISESFNYAYHYWKGRVEFR